MKTVRISSIKRQEISDLLLSVKVRLFFERMERRLPRVKPDLGRDRGYDERNDDKEFYLE